MAIWRKSLSLARAGWGEKEAAKLIDHTLSDKFLVYHDLQETTESANKPQIDFIIVRNDGRILVVEVKTAKSYYAGDVDVYVTAAKNDTRKRGVLQQAKGALHAILGISKKKDISLAYNSITFAVWLSHPGKYAAESAKSAIAGLPDNVRERIIIGNEFNKTKVNALLSSKKLSEDERVKNLINIDKICEFPGLDILDIWDDKQTLDYSLVDSKKKGSSVTKKGPSVFTKKFQRPKRHPKRIQDVNQHISEQVKSLTNNAIQESDDSYQRKPVTHNQGTSGRKIAFTFISFAAIAYFLLSFAHVQSIPPIAPAVAHQHVKVKQKHKKKVHVHHKAYQPAPAHRQERIFDMPKPHKERVKPVYRNTKPVYVEHIKCRFMYNKRIGLNVSGTVMCGKHYQPIVIPENLRHADIYMENPYIVFRLSIKGGGTLEKKYKVKRPVNKVDIPKGLLG